MIIPMFDQARKKEDSTYGESVRLSNELRSSIPKTVLKRDGTKEYTVAKWGFNCESADYSDFKKWQNDKTIKKSPSLFWFVVRIMAWRFPESHNDIRNNLVENRKHEFDMILSHMKKEVEWIGLTGYQNSIMLDGSMNNPRTKDKKFNNDRIRTVRK